MSDKPTYFELEQRVRELEAIETEYEHTREALAEREKELQCYRNVAHLAETPGITEERLLQGIAEIIPSSWHYPRFTGACVVYQGREYKTANFRETEFSQHASYYVNGENAGYIQVCRLDAVQEGSEVFLEEEHTLLDNLAERLGRVIERIHSQQAATATERMYQAIFDQSIEGVFLHGIEGGIVDVNRAACRQTGYAKQELLQLSVFDLHPEGSRINIPRYEITHTWKQLQPSERIYVEAEHQRKDGSVIPVQISTGLVRHLDKVMMVAIVQDISERKRAQEEAEEKERYLSTILSTTVEGFWVLDTKGKFVETNESFCRQIGYGRDLLLGMSITDVDADETPEDTADRIERIIRNGSEIFDTRHRRKDGSIFPVEVSVTHLPDRGGRFVSFSRDLTERKMAEDALRISEEKYRALYDNAPLSYQSLDENGCFLDVNPTWLRTLGYKRDEVIGSCFADYLHPSWKPHFEKNFPAFKKRGYVQDVQFKIRHKEGHYVDISFEGCVGHNPDGTFRQTYCVFQDITARKQAEDALLESAEALKKAQSVAHVGSWEWDIVTGQLQWSDEMYRIFGIDKDDFSGALDDVLKRSIHPDDRAAVDASNQSVINQKKPIPVEYRIVRPDGSIRTVWAEAGELVFDEHGTPARLSGIVMDITERRLAEESSRRSERLLKEAQAIAHIGNWEWRPKDDHLSWSDEIYRIMGYEPGVFEPSTEILIDAVHPDDKEEFLARREVIYAKRESGVMTYRIMLPSGLIRVVEARFQFVFDENGNTTRLVGTLQDISERDAYEKKLRAANVRLEALWSVSSLGEADISEVSNYVIRTITAMTGSSYAFYGFINEDESVMKINSWSGDAMNDCAIMNKPMDFPVDKAGLWAEAIRRRTPLIVNDYSQELPGKKGLPDGHVKLTNLLVVPHSIDGRCVSLAAVANRDTDYDEEDVKQLSSFLQGIHGILASKQAMKEKEILQKQLANAQKLESIGSFAGGVAHDFNNMLSVILGNVELLLEDLDPEESLYGRILEIQQAAHRSRDLTHQLLALARKQTAAPKILDLNETIESMLTMLRRLIEENIDLVWEPGNTHERIRIDPGQVNQILTNLLVNARDAIAHDIGKVTIGTATVELDEEYCSTHAGTVPGLYVMLTVSDNGCGMDKEIRDHIFDPFFTTKPRGEGTGLGLATVYGIIRQNEGFINMYSEPGLGSTFRIYFPVHKTRAGEAEKESVQDAAMTGAGETILLVEDEPSILSLGMKMLERLGYRVIVASAPGEAIRLAKEYHGNIDLLMTDVVMPEMNGRELSRRLISMFPEMKCLFMSGYTADVIAHHGVLDDDIVFIEKPFVLADLGRKVHEALKSKEV